MSSPSAPGGDNRPSSQQRPTGDGDRPTGHAHDDPPGSHAVAGRPAGAPTSKEVVRAQKERFGGMKFGACFFGWLTATGTALLLTALLAAAGAALGLANGVTGEVAAQNAETVGLAGGIALLAVLFVAYLAGGYVAGRMARFSGAKQGVGVWLWAVVLAVVVAILTAIAGARSNVLANLNGVPSIPINEATLTTGGILTAIGIVLVSLLGAVLGGLAGMRYHRRVDRTSLDQLD